jgi:ADP-heptose:LPS heptosyltransferase
MGFGDDLIVTSIVKRAFTVHKKPLCIGDGVVRWEEVFDHNPKISRQPYPGCVWIPNIMGNRPYIDHPKCRPKKIAYRNDFKVEPGEIYLSPEEKARYEDFSGFVYIEPNVKGTFSGNKDWGFERWQEVVKRLPFRFVQGKGRRLEGVEQVCTESFRDACALLDRADFFVGTDGGLHHAAAALGKRAVVVWGGLVSPKILGYDTHINLHSGTHSCGSYDPCEHCRKALDWVTVDKVCQAITGLHEERQRDLAA